MSNRIQSGEKKSSFVRVITLVHFIIMIIKQISAVATFFQNIPGLNLDEPTLYLICNLFYKAVTV